MPGLFSTLSSALLSLCLLTGCNSVTINNLPEPSISQHTSGHAVEVSKIETPAPPIAPVQPVLEPPTQYTIPILVYHHVRPQQNWAKSTWSWKMTVSPEVFDRQMQWLVEHGYTSITLDTFLDIIEGKILGPEKPVVITFDDNNLNQYDTALPILEKYHQRAVFYLVSNKLDIDSVVNRERALDMLARGMDIQSHTVSHANLTNLSNDQLAWQLVESRRQLEELTGKPIYHIAYPLTAHNQRVRDATKAAGYKTGTIMDPRPVNETSNLFKLPRIMMTDETDLERVLP